MPPSAEGAAASFSHDHSTGKNEQNSSAPRAVVCSRQRNDARVHSMPVIPEEFELTGTSLTGAQKAMDLLKFALEDEPAKEVQSQGGVLQDGAKRAMELIKFACAKYDGEEDEIIEEKRLPRIGKNSKQLQSLEARDTDLDVAHKNVGKFRKLKKAQARALHEENLQVDPEQLLEPDVECGDQAQVHPPLVAVDCSGAKASQTQRKEGKFVQVLAMVLFGLLNLQFVAIIVAVALIVGSLIPAVAVAGVGSLVWGVLFMCNLAIGAQTRLVLQTFLHKKQKSRFPGASTSRRVVVVKGVASKLDGKCLPSDFRHDGEEYLMVDTSLKPLPPKRGKKLKLKEHVRQTRAVNFRVTDPTTGLNVIVDAQAAAETGVIVPLVDVTATLPLRTSPELLQVLTDEDEVRQRTHALESAQWAVHEGYIREGQEVTVMGCLTVDAARREDILRPLQHSHNVSKFLLVYKVLPIFFPVWVSGLVISTS